MRPDETFGSRSTEEIGNALQSLVNTATPHDRARILREQSHLVLTDKAVELLNSNIQRASERADAEAVGVFEHVCSLVKLARSQGLDAAIASLEHEDLLNTLRPFIECSSWSERKTMLETNSDVLLGESARKVLQELLEINEDPHAISLLQALSALLTVARRSGIQEGFVWLQNQLLANLAKAVGEGQHDNAALLIKELQGITDRDDWVEINSRVIDVVTEHTQQIDNRDWLFELMREELAAAPTPLSRAALAVRLGSSFANPDNEEHITQSIAWLRQSLEAFESTGYSFRGVYGTLGRAFLVKESGDREGNLLTAHDYLQRELQTLDRTVDPASWAITQRLLGRVLMLLNRREPAIEHLAASLDEEPDGLDEGYAQAGLNLARLRLKEQGPGRQTAIEQAIADLQRAVVKAPENSRLWARIESVLGNIYRQRKSGDPAANFEQGFYHENQALRVFTRKLFPNEWAQVQHNLGTLYSTDIRGDRSDNIERAIVCYHNVLRVHTKEAYPQYYGLTSSALGFAMIERSAGVREQNLEDALHLLKEAEGTLDPKESATWLAECRNGIGMLYSERLSGDERQNLLQAAEYFELSRNAYHDLGDKERERIGFSNLAAVYTRLGNFDPDAKVKGIRYAQQALEGTGQDTDPYDWAMFNRNLGAAILSQEVTTANLNQALGCLSNALKVFRPDTYLAEYRVSQNYLGHVHFLNRSWELALQAYQASIKAGELSLASAYTEPGRRSVVHDTELAHVRSAYCLIQLGRFDEALVAVEAGKTRLLRETLTRSEVFPATMPEELVHRLRSGQESVRALEGRMRQAVSSRKLNIAAIGQKLHEARAELEQIAAEIRTYTPDFGEPIDNVSEILEEIPQNGALVTFVVTSHGGFGIVVNAGAKNIEHKHIISLPLLTSETVNNVVNRWLGLVGAASTLQSADRFASWLAAQRTSMNNLWEGLAEPIHMKLIELGVNEGSCLLILPQGGLWSIPLQAAARQVGNRQRALADDYTIIQTPSIYVRKLCVSRKKQRAELQSSLLAVVNPSGDLPFAVEEVSLIAPRFRDPILLDHTSATLELVLRQSKAASYLHFACHGRHDWSDPMMSSLKLASDDSLLLSTIFAELVIDSNRLVVLSACESGISDLSGATEEFVGLPTGFLLAGAIGVISSLWKVEDAATCLLMSRFYESHIQNGDAPEDALRAAQKWLRDLTVEDLVDLNSAGLRLIDLYPDQIISRSSTERICDYPFFWAGFTFVGA